MTQVHPSGLSSQRDVFDAGPVCVICCDGQTGIGTVVSPMIVFPFAGEVCIPSTKSVLFRKLGVFNVKYFHVNCPRSFLNWYLQ